MGASFGWRAAASFLLLGDVLPALGGCPDWLEASFILALGRLGSCAADLKVVCGRKGSPRGLGLVLSGGLKSEDWGLLSPFLFFPAVDLWHVAADFGWAVHVGCSLNLNLNSN
ncbi:hypothetical protein OIU79_013845 [Salix purpurea]|uniref:Secreted protein n=1 Tax=Salix purpurea TaxID=77065 RepID=A0A9Q0SWJ2_SALPP|nr:hypothetical protein OIU79_013845 [Salix purpurea]